eukprot:s9548_g1.t1
MQVMFLSPQEKDIFGPLLQLAGPGTPEQVATPKPDGGPKRRGSPPGSGSRQWPKWPRKTQGERGQGEGKGTGIRAWFGGGRGPPASSDCTASTASRGCHIHSASRQGHAVLPEDRGAGILPANIVQSLFNLSQAWNKEREKPIAQRQEPLSPLRIVLVKAFLSEMAARITKVTEDPEVRKKVIAAGWATQEADQTLSWHFQMYDAEKKQEHVDQGKPPLPHARIMQLLEGVAESLRPEVVQRFHATRPQAESQPSATLDDGQLAVYLHFRGVPLSGVVDLGTFFYFEQHEYEYEEQRQEVAQQLQTTLADMDYFGVLAFFRHMLEGALLESFYTEVYRLVLARLRSAERVSFFADVIRPLPTDMAEADDDA